MSSFINLAKRVCMQISVSACTHSFSRVFLHLAPDFFEVCVGLCLVQYLPVSVCVCVCV